MLTEEQEAYEKLMLKREDFTKPIENDEDLAKEEEWLERAIEMFITVEISRKKYVSDQSIVTLMWGTMLYSID